MGAAINISLLFCEKFLFDVFYVFTSHLPFQKRNEEIVREEERRRRKVSNLSLRIAIRMRFHDETSQIDLYTYAFSNPLTMPHYLSFLSFLSTEKVWVEKLGVLLILKGLSCPFWDHFLCDERVLRAERRRRFLSRASHIDTARNCCINELFGEGGERERDAEKRREVGVVGHWNGGPGRRGRELAWRQVFEGRVGGTGSAIGNG